MRQPSNAGLSIFGNGANLTNLNFGFRAILLMALALCSWSSSAADPSSGSILPTNLGGDSTPNTNLGNQFSGCNTTDLSSFKSQIMSGLGRNADGTAKPASSSSATPDQLCRPPDPDSFPKVPDSCSSLLPLAGAEKSSSGAGYKTLKDQLNALIGQADCAANLVKSMQKDLDCVRTQMQATAKAIADEAAKFNAYRNLANSEVQLGDKYLRQLKAEEEQIDKWLNGDGKAGIGLIKAREDLKILDSQVDQLINGPVNGPLSSLGGGVAPLFQQVQQLRDDFETKAVPEYESGLSRNCIETNLSSKYVCHRGDPAAKLSDFLQCAFSNSIKAGNSGGDPNAADATQSADAEARAKRLADAYSNLVGDFKTYQQFPKGIGDAGDADPWDKDPGTILDASSSALGRHYFDITSLGQMSDRELAAWQKATGTESPFALVQSVTDSCMAKAHSQVKKERAAKSGVLASAQKSITKTEDAVWLKAQGMLTSFDDALKKSADVMQFVYKRPDLTQCARSFGSQRMIDCLTTQKQAISDMYRGGESTQKFWYIGGKGADGYADTALNQRFPQLLATIACKGLEDCVTRLSAESSHRVDMQKDGKDARNAFLAQQNAALDNMISGTAGSYNQSVGALSAQIDKLNLAFGALEVDPMTKDLYTDCPQPEFDSVKDMDPPEELMKQPKDFNAAVGCKTAPPLKLDGKVFETAGKSLGTVLTKAASAKNKANSALAELDNKLAECKQKAKDEFEAASTDLGNCWSTSKCPVTKNQKFSGEWEQIAKALGTGGPGSDTSGSLSDGINDSYCQEPKDFKPDGDFCELTGTESSMRIKLKSGLTTEFWKSHCSACMSFDQTKDKDSQGAATYNANCEACKKEKEATCTDANKDLRDVITNNNSSCEKKFSGAVGKARQVNVIDWSADGNAKSGDN